MSSCAIKINNVSKLFRIGCKERQHDTLSASVASFFKSPLDNYRRYRSLYRFDDVNLQSEEGNAKDSEDVLWALRDVSFDIAHGEVVGIIGGNGAGKSTLLKVMSRITPPTKGSIELRGRVGSLLEVGTGFHPELSGRENVYLNGTILGMTKREVDRRFDEIVDFSGVEKFLDTPVKRYSSGMRVRLAFAVAAHLDPEILIIDEVLAVGDSEFQKKCLNRMKDVGAEGRTVLFVSHSMPAITRLCPRAILMQAGKIIADGPAHKVVATHLHSGHGIAVCEWEDAAKAPGRSVVRLRAVRVRDRQGNIAEACDIRQPVGLEMEYDVLQSGHVLLPHFQIKNEDDIEVFSAHDLDAEWRGKDRPSGRYRSTAWIPGNLMAEGMFFVTAALITLNPNSFQFCENEVVAFQVIDNNDGDTARGDWVGNMGGVMRPMLEWDTVFQPER